MPRPLFKVPETKAKTQSVLRINQNRKQQNKVDKMKLDRLLRQKRSKTYMDAMNQLDAGGHVHNQETVNKIINAIQNELPEIEMTDILLGVVAKCYLGDSYEVHSLDCTGRIIQHFKKGEPLLYGMEKARGIAIHGGYAFIEVYAECCRAVSEDGTVSVIPC